VSVGCTCKKRCWDTYLVSVSVLHMFSSPPRNADKPERLLLPFDLCAKEKRQVSSHIPLLRQGTHRSMVTSSPDNMDVLANKELPRTVSIDSPEAISNSRLRKRKVINYAEDSDTDDSPDTESAQLETVESKEVVDMTTKEKQASTSLSPPSNEEYDVVFPVTPDGLLFSVRPGIDGSTVFFEYLRYADGRKGPAELYHWVRNVGDRIVAVNQVSTSQLSYLEVVSLLRNCRTKKYATVRFQVSTRSMTPSLPSGPSTSPPPSNEPYDVVFPVTPHGLLFSVSPGIDGSTVFLKYDRYPDGSKGPVELNRWVRNVGDRIVAVNQVSTSQLSYTEVLSLLRNCRTKKYATVRFQASAHSMMSSLPSDPSTGKRRAVPSADAHLTKKTARDESTLNPWRAAPTPPSEDEYDAVLPISAEHGLMIRLADRDGLTEFLGYSQYADGGKGPAELRKLIRNKGDRIVAVNGVMTSSFPHVWHLIRESKRKADAHCVIRFRNINSKSYVKVRDRFASKGRDTPLNGPSPRGMHWDATRGIWVHSVGEATKASSHVPFAISSPDNIDALANKELPGTVSINAPEVICNPSSDAVYKRPAGRPRKVKRPAGRPRKYKRPAGRPPKGMDWDATRGVWVPSVGEATKSSSHIPSLRQGTQFSKATLSPDNKDALANKELPGTVSTDAPEAIYKSRLRKRKVINYTEVNKKRKVKNYTEINGTDDSPDTESAQLATNDSIDAIDMTMEY
jgi:hypothetical protein